MPGTDYFGGTNFGGFSGLGGTTSSTPQYGWGLYGSPWGTYGDLSSAYYTPERITRDRFERTVAVSTAIGVDDTSLFTWANSSSSLVNLNGHQLVFKGTSATQTYRPTLPVALQDGRVFMQWEFDADLTNINDGYLVSIIFRKISSTTWYRLLFSMQQNGANAWAIQKTSNTGATYTNLTWTSVGTQEIVSPLPTAAGDNKIDMMIDFAGTLLRAKIWDDAKSEPGWVMLSNDSSISAAGDIGIEIVTGDNEVTFPSIKVNYIVVTNSVTTAQVSGAGVPSSSDHEAAHDTATVIGAAVISSIDHAAYHDASTISGAGVISSSEAGASTDAATVIGAAVISSTDHAAYHDAATSSGAGVPSGAGTTVTTDAATVIAAAVISATEHAAYHDAATVSGAGVPSESDHEAATDANTVIGAGVPSATEHAAYLDAATVTAAGVPSASEAQAAHDTATVIGAAVISSTDSAAYVDANTAQGAGVPSESDHETSTEAATVIGIAVISATESAHYHDAATISGAGVPSSTDHEVASDQESVISIAVISATDTAAYLDANTAIGVGVISASEHYTQIVTNVDAATIIGQGIISSVEVFKTAPPAFVRRIRGFQLSGKMTITLGV